MLKAFSLVWVQVSDMAQSIAFYRDVLGADFCFESEHWSEVNLCGVRIGLHKAFSPHRPLGKHDVGWVIGFEVEDLIGFKVLLESSGVHVHENFDETPGGVLMMFEDPDGHPIQVIQPGSTLKSLGL